MVESLTTVLFVLNWCAIWIDLLETAILGNNLSVCQLNTAACYINFVLNSYWSELELVSRSTKEWIAVY